MGGPGSGRWGRQAKKRTIESYLLKLDIKMLRERGFPAPGDGIFTWFKNGKEIGLVHFTVSDEILILRFNQVARTILIAQTACRFGGFRYWFCCPKCKQKTAVLYFNGEHFTCRECSDLCYASQQTGKADRLRLRALKIRQKLGAGTDLDTPILSRPKHMHRATFDRLKQEETRFNV